MYKDNVKMALGIIENEFVNYVSKNPFCTTRDIRDALGLDLPCGPNGTHKGWLFGAIAEKLITEGRLIQHQDGPHKRKTYTVQTKEGSEA